MTNVQQTRVAVVLTAVFIIGLIIAVLVLSVQQRQTSAANTARRDAQLTGLICVARLLPDELSNERVVDCLKAVTP